jgi:two-component system chemotaxis response regulator CheB
MTLASINVLVVDDSAVARMHLVHLLEADPRIRVIGAVNDGHAALEFLEKKQPDVVLMDVNMPGLDGFETTRRIMETRPVPIIICSGVSNPKDVASTFRVLEAGAVACVEKPVGCESADFQRMAGELRQTVILMSEVRVVKRWPRQRGASVPVLAAARPRDLQPAATEIKLIAIGASTGGPPLLEKILSGLPKDFPAPILIVQHIAPGFLTGLVEWLSQTTGLCIHVAAHGAIPLPGHVYLAPDDFHMGISSTGCILLTREEARNSLRPSVSCLFRSVAQAYGPRAIGVLLTGMGKDGAAELKDMRDKGAVTIAQDRDSSVVHGMPGEAIALGGASYVLPGDKIADALVRLIARDNHNGGN